MLALKAGEDFHTSTAARIFGVEYNEVTNEQRVGAKAVNFGIIYGQQAFGLARILGIEVDKAKKIIELYFGAYPSVKRYLDESVVRATKCGYAQTIFGRRRPLPNLTSQNHTLRAESQRFAMNHPIQGSQSDIIKIAMKNIQSRLIDEGLQTKMLLQVHDELDFSVPKGEIDKVCEIVRHEMENAVNLRVKMSVDISWGKNWAQAH